MAISELTLSLDHDSAGYSVYLMEGGKVMESLTFANSKHALYYQLLACNRVLESIHRKVLTNEYNKPHATLLDNR